MAIKRFLPDFLRSWGDFVDAMEWINTASLPILVAKDSISQLDDPELRAKVMLSAIEGSALNDIVTEWEMDNVLVLDQLDASPGLLKVMDTSRIGIMGMSLGGAVAAEVCKEDSRIKAGVNIDGLQYGNRNHQALDVPFMMVYSRDGADSNEFLMLNSQHDFHQYTIPQARHSDFTDMTLIWPVLRVYGQLGEVPSLKMLRLTNDMLLSFWDHYFKEKPLRKVEESYPEAKAFRKFKPITTKMPETTTTSRATN